MPFDAKSLRAAGYDAIRKVLREQDAPKPSTRLLSVDNATGAEIARHRVIQREHLASQLRRELDWIPLKALRMVASASFSADGARIVTASEDGTARVWDAQTGASLAELKGHAGAVVSAWFSADGARIVTASVDKTARVWDATTGASLAELKGHTGTVASASFSADGTRIVTASSDGTARVWDSVPSRERYAEIAKSRPPK